MKTITILSLLIILITPAVPAQTLHSILELNDLLHEKKVHETGEKDGVNEYTGSPYENDEFIKGELMTKSDNMFQNVPMRLNIYNNSIEYKDNDGNIFTLDNPGQFKYITIGESTFRYLPFVFGNKTKNGWFKVVNDGDATLLLKPHVNFEEATKPGVYVTAKPASFKRAPDEIFIKRGEKPAIEVKNKKSLGEIFPAEESEIKTYIKENKIKISDAEDMKKLVSFLNSK